MIEIVKRFNVFCWFRDIKQLNECTVVYQMFAYVKMLYLHHNYNHIISVYSVAFQVHYHVKHHLQYIQKEAFYTDIDDEELPI